MGKKNLTASYLARLSNANHDGVTEQISDRLTAFTTDNQMLVQAIALVQQRRQAEDVAYKRFRGKDFASDDLKHEDQLEDKYMSATLAILNGLLFLPESEPMRRKAQLARQVFKDFDFSTSDGFEAEARKTINMVQQWQAATEYTLAELGVAEWVDKAVLQAQKVLQLVTVRIDNESVKVKGELAAARKATDEAIRMVFDLLNALAVIQPTAELTQLTNILFSIEERAKLYYISSGSGSGTGSSGNSGNAGNTGDTGNAGGSGDSGNTGGTGDGGSSGGTGDGGDTGDSGDSGSSSGSGGSEGTGSGSGSGSGGSEGSGSGSGSGGYDPDNGDGME